MKIEQSLGRFRASVERLEGGADLHEGFEYQMTQLPDLSGRQSDVASEIIRSVERNSPKLMFVQGSAGTGKTHMIQVILWQLHRRGIRFIMSSTTGIAAVQYQGGQTFHSLPSLGIDEEQSSNFTSNVGQGTARAWLLLSARLIVIDEVSMLAPSVSGVSRSG
jgi:RecG-like helicase